MRVALVTAEGALIEVSRPKAQHSIGRYLCLLTPTEFSPRHQQRGRARGHRRKNKKTPKNRRDSDLGPTFINEATEAVNQRRELLGRSGSATPLDSGFARSPHRRRGRLAGL